MESNQCLCWCGRVWRACGKHEECLRELHGTLKKAPSARAVPRKPKVSLAEITEAFERAKAEAEE